MGAELTTYLLHGLTAFDVAEIRSMEPLYFEVGRFGYGVLVAGFAPTNDDRVGRRLPGDNRDVVGGWLQQRGVDRFVSEYEKSRPPPEEGQRALEAWREIAEKRIVLEHEAAELLSRRRKVMDALREARQGEVDASADVVRKTGKTLLKIGEEVWELREYRTGLKFYRTRGSR